MRSYELNPADNEFQKLVADMNNRIKALEIPRRPFLADYNVVSEPISRVDNTSVQFDDPDYDITNLYFVGDKIRIEQNSSYIYFYIKNINVSTRTIELMPEDFSSSFYVSNSFDIDEFAYSRIQNPSGHPKLFKHQINSVTPSSGTLDDNDETIILNSQGAFFTNYIYLFFQTASGFASGTIDYVLENFTDKGLANFSSDVGVVRTTAGIYEQVVPPFWSFVGTQAVDLSFVESGSDVILRASSPFGPFPAERQLYLRGVVPVVLD